MEQFIDRLRSRYGNGHNVTKGLRKKYSVKFDCSETFIAEVKLNIPIVVGTPKINPISPFEEDNEKYILEKTKVEPVKSERQNDNIKNELLMEIEKCNSDMHKYV
ncbi:MAG: hypothetical protein Edafosvirus54_5, partial [Edafosvirus sp.]